MEPWMSDIGSFGGGVQPGDEYASLLADLEGNTNLADVGKTKAGKLLGGVGRALGGAKFDATSALQLAPAIYNIGQGLFGKPDLQDPSDYSNTLGLAEAAKLKGRKYDVDPELRASRRAFDTGRRNLRSAARSRGELLSGYAGLSAREAGAEADIYSRKQNIENQYASEAAQAYMGLGAQEAANRARVDDYNARARAAQQNLLGTGLSQVSQIAQAGMQRENQREADRLRLSNLQTMYPNLRYNVRTGRYETV